MDPVKIALMMETGMSAVCATCTKMWDALDRGSPVCGQTGCCGPPLGGTFIKYSGPANLEGVCFACGLTTEYAVRVGGSPRALGVCPKHFRLLAKGLDSTGKPLPRREIFRKGCKVGPENLEAQPKKSLFRDIMEAEAHFEKQHSKKR